MWADITPNLVLGLMLVAMLAAALVIGRGNGKPPEDGFV